MSEIKIEGNWDIYSDYLKRRWNVLTEEDLDFSDGNVEGLVQRIIARTGTDQVTVAKVIKLASISGDVC